MSLVRSQAGPHFRIDIKLQILQNKLMQPDLTPQPGMQPDIPQPGIQPMPMSEAQPGALPPAPEPQFGAGMQVSPDFGVSTPGAQPTLTPSPDIPAAPAAAPAQTEGQNITDELRAHNEARTEDPTIQSAKRMAEILGEKFSGDPGGYYEALSAVYDLASKAARGKAES